RLRTLDVHAIRALVRLAVATARATVEEAHPAGKGERAMAAVEPSFDAALEALRSEHRVHRAGEPDPGPRLVERARAGLRTERSRSAVGEPAGEVQATRCVRRSPCTGRGAPVLGRQPELEVRSGPERVDPAEAGEGGELPFQARSALGASEAIGRFRPAAGEDEKEDPVQRPREPGGADCERLPGLTAAGEPRLRGGETRAGRVERQDDSEGA